MTIFRIPQPFETVDASLADALPGYLGDSWCEVHRESITSRSARYHLRNAKHGDFGTIKLRTRPDDTTELEATGPSIQYRAQHYKSVADWQQNALQRRQDHEERKRHFEEVINLTMQRLSDLWPAEPAQASAAHDEHTARPPRVPKQQKRLNEWRAIWRKIKSEWRRGRAYYEIRDWLHAQDTQLERSEDILAEIITAGEAGLLDLDPPENSR